MRHVNILGTKYVIKELYEQEDPILSDCNGYCDDTVREIVVQKWDDNEDEFMLKDIERFRRKVLRHEIIHAFLNESGLMGCSDWARNEEMVDFFANQFPKMVKSMTNSGALEGDI